MGDIFRGNIKMVKDYIFITSFMCREFCFSFSYRCCVFMRIRSEKACVRGVDSTTNKQWKHEKLCGRPLGLRFHKETGNLYIADAYYGLLVVGPEGGIATPLATHVEGKPILFANDLDIHRNGSIFFTDTSKRYDRA